MGELTNSISSRDAFQETEALVLRLKEGEEAAFAEVFQLYKDLIYTLALSMLADKSEAMDVTQEVFLTLFRKIHQFRGDSTLKTWLYRVAINKAANRNRWWRRRFRHRTVSLRLNGEGRDQQELDPASPSPLPDRQTWSREVRRVLQSCLGQLPFEQRAAVTLRDVQGLAYQEIAGILGLRVGTVKSRIARGREKLRELLEPCREGGVGS